jgi:dTMP kinase
MSNDRGCFITLEGAEGVGKSTHLPFVTDFLRGHGLEVIQTREPGGTALAEDIRRLFLAAHEMPPESELLLLFAARASHLQEVIVPALTRGAWVVCDRFTDATYAYQGGGRGIDPAWIASLETHIQGELRPDWVLVLDAPVVVGRARAAARRGTVDRIEGEGDGFFERVRQIYRERARRPGYRLVDASGSIEAVQLHLRQILEDILRHECR